MSIIVVADAEDIVLAWLKTLTIATLPAENRFLQPKGNPLPRVQLSQVGVASENDGFSVVRISFQVVAANRPQAKSIKKALKGELLSLNYAGDVVTSQGVLLGAEVVSDVWYPDPESDTPKYIVDARVAVRPT